MYIYKTIYFCTCLIKIYLYKFNGFTTEYNNILNTVSNECILEADNDVPYTRLTKFKCVHHVLSNERPE